MERLTERKRNFNGTAMSKKSMIDREGYPVVSDYASKVLTKLADYEDAEEQGLLLRLPCKVGSNIYRITDDGVDVADCREIRVADEEMYIESNTFCDWISFEKIGKTVFLTEAEAEAKLAEMEGAE